MCSPTEVRHEFFDIPERTRLTFFVSQAEFQAHLSRHFANPREAWTRVLEGAAVTYEAVVDALTRGIQFAQGRPLYVRLRVCRGGREEIGFYFLALHGFIVVARGEHVRTAFFPGDNPNTSWYNLFRLGWLDAHRRASRTEYDDTASRETVAQDNREWFSPENWAACRNPHPRPLA